MSSSAFTSKTLTVPWFKSCSVSCDCPDLERSVLSENRDAHAVGLPLEQEGGPTERKVEIDEAQVAQERGQDRTLDAQPGELGVDRETQARCNQVKSHAATRRR